MKTSEPRIGDWMQTSTGKQFWPLDPRAAEVSIDDIANALSKICRFGGHCREFYSVAQHSVHVARLVEETHPELAMHALLHDAAEAYLGDHIHPVKSTLRTLREGIDESVGRTEWRVLRVIAAALGLRELTDAELEVIKRADAVMLATEARDLMGDPKWPSLPEPEPQPILALSPHEAVRLFDSMFYRLRASRTGERSAATENQT